MTFGEWLRAARKRKKWTMEQLGLRASITKSYVWELEQDHQNPSLRVLWKLADAFGVKLSTIIKALEGR